MRRSGVCGAGLRAQRVRGHPDSFPYGLFFPGFVVLCLARFGRSEEAQKSFARFVESGTSSDVDRALAYMGLGRIDEAVKELSLACDDGDPLMLWLHLWPIFDPLRNHKGFKALLKRIGLARNARYRDVSGVPPLSAQNVLIEQAVLRPPLIKSS